MGGRHYSHPGPGRLRVIEGAGSVKGFGARVVT